MIEKFVWKLMTHSMQSMMDDLDEKIHVDRLK